jgi:hypothetical protein
MRRTRGVSRNLMFKFNQFSSELMERKKSQNYSTGEILDKSGSKK